MHAFISSQLIIKLYTAGSNKTATVATHDITLYCSGYLTLSQQATHDTRIFPTSILFNNHLFIYNGDSQ